MEPPPNPQLLGNIQFPLHSASLNPTETLHTGVSRSLDFADVDKNTINWNCHQNGQSCRVLFHMKDSKLDNSVIEEVLSENYSSN